MLSPGTMLGGRYRLDERIAGGGMGDVWRGTDEVLGRTVAIKVLLPALMEEQGFAERFRGEARTMATINHPGVVDVYDYGSEQGTAFLIMEYIEGDALARTLSRVGRLTPARAMALIAQAADALEAAHVRGIVHRDVKPGNLLVRPNGTLVLTDFGIARSAQAAQLTAVGSVLGTASYISPEQASGQQATPLSDVYALGVVAYQCLAGKRPFEGDNPLDIALRHVREMPPPLPPDIPPAVRQIVERALSKDPAARWPSAEALAAAARNVSGQLSSGGTGTMVPPSQAINQPAPFSGPPMSPAAGSPPGPPDPVAQGGTRMFTSPHQASGPPGAGGFARGTAGVAPPPKAQDTGYAFAAPRSPAGPGRATTSPDGSRRTLIILIGVLTALVVLLACGVGVYVLTSRESNDDSDPGGGAPETPATTQTRLPDTTQTEKTTAPSRSAAGDLITLNCEQYKGQQRLVVETKIRQKGFKVRIEMVDAGGRINEVVDVTPCQAYVGDTITIKVSTGNSDAQSSEPADESACDGLPLDPNGSCPASSQP